ncbi:MAG: hypothetical protein WD266_03340 [Balneolales bacterium]
MKTAWILGILFTLSAYTRVMVTPEPTIQQIIIHYGDQLGLSGDQKSALAGLRLHRRKAGQGRRMRPGRRPPVTAGIYQDVYEILSVEQTDMLKILLSERIQKEHEFRMLRYDEILRQAGVENGKVSQVMDILDRQSQELAALSRQRIQHPGETNREHMQEAFSTIRKGNREVRDILTANEYEKFRKFTLPSDHWRQSAPRP